MYLPSKLKQGVIVTKHKPINILNNYGGWFTLEATNTNLVFVGFILDAEFFDICILQFTCYLPKNTSIIEFII